MTACGASFAVSSPAFGLMSKTATLQPSSARRSVSPRPIPCPPPVTTATFPDRPFNADLPCCLLFLSCRTPPHEGRLQRRHLRAGKPDATYEADPFFCSANPRCEYI